MTRIIWWEFSISIRFPVGGVILSALVLDTSHTLDSNSILEQSQRFSKAVLFWCDDNDILNNVTLQVFLPIRQVCQQKGDISSLSNNSYKQIDTGLSWIKFHKISAMYSELKQKRDPPSITFIPKPVATHCFLHWPEKKDCKNISPRTSLNIILIWLSNIIFPWE